METYTLCGAKVALLGVSDTYFVDCEVGDDRDRKSRHNTLKDADGFGSPCDNILITMAEYPIFERIDNIVDQDMNLCFRFREEEDSGGGRWR